MCARRRFVRKPDARLPACPLHAVALAALSFAHRHGPGFPELSVGQLVARNGFCCDLAVAIRSSLTARTSSRAAAPGRDCRASAPLQTDVSFRLRETRER